MVIANIDPELCVGCGTCSKSCCMDVIRIDDFILDIKETPPCRAACPAGVDMRSFNYLIKNNRLVEALNCIIENNPMPAITGRVCFHPCEQGCARKEVDEAVNINALERFVAEKGLDKTAEPISPIYIHKVAIIGSGPAGLTAAHKLIKLGYWVTVFESSDSAGGMLRFGIPGYRLPKKILDKQINYFEEIGIEFILNSTFGQDITLAKLKNMGYSAVLLAMGAPLAKIPDIEGIKLEGVLTGLEFLRKAAINPLLKLKNHVTVIGGGNVAIDTALTALRLGAKTVELVCLESRETMPAYPEEIKQALAEGVRFNCGYGPERIVGIKNAVSRIELVQCLSVFDKKGAFNPCFEKTKTKSITTDLVIFAVGQSIDMTTIPTKIKNNNKGLVIDRSTMGTPLPGVFAAGDMVTGPASVVESIAAGNRAAVSIHRYLMAGHLPDKGPLEEQAKDVEKPPKEGIISKPRQEVSLLKIDERQNNFKEIKLGFDELTALKESQRCMACGSKAIIVYPEDCMTCYSCELDCTQKAIYVDPRSDPQYLPAWG